MTTLTPQDFLISLIQYLANGQSLDIVIDPPELLQVISKATTIANEFGVAPPMSYVRRIASASRGLFISNWALIVGNLKPDLDATVIESQVLEFQRQAAIALTWLPEKYRCDLMLFLVAPPGASDEPAWLDAAPRIERNEQVCRKLVWLPPTNTSGLSESCNEFCRRTFLSRPWSSSASRGPETLDPLARLSAGDPVFQRWLRILSLPTESDADLEEQLIEAWSENLPEQRDVP